MSEASAPEKKLITVDFLRHGEPQGGDVLRGRIDHPLSELGWQQMRRAAALNIENRPTDLTPNWTHLISSPLQRCREFAETLALKTDTSLQVVDDWQEIDYGDWDGMQLSDWREKAAPQFKEFRKDVSKLNPPGGEQFLLFKDRVLGVWDSLAEFPDGSHVLVVTHGGVLRVILPTVLGMPLNRSYPLHIPFASFSRMSLMVDANSARVSASLKFHNAAEYAGGSEGV